MKVKELKRLIGKELFKIYCDLVNHDIDTDDFENSLGYYDNHLVPDDIKSSIIKEKLLETVEKNTDNSYAKFVYDDVLRYQDNEIKNIILLMDLPDNEIKAKTIIHKFGIKNINNLLSEISIFLIKLYKFNIPYKNMDKIIDKFNFISKLIHSIKPRIEEPDNNIQLNIEDITKDILKLIHKEMSIDKFLSTINDRTIEVVGLVNIDNIAKSEEDLIRLYQILDNIESLYR